MTTERLIDTVRLLATPIDFDHLIQDGILAGPRSGWYEVTDMKRLPEHAWQQVSEIKSEPSTDNTSARNYLKFGQSGPAAAKLYEQLTGKRLDA